MGQGGYTCFRFADAIGEPVTMALRSKIPLETDLLVIEHEDGWQLIDPTAPETSIMDAATWAPDFATTDPVSIEAAEGARLACKNDETNHPAPHCLSCGFGDRSLRVQAGPLGDGRFASPFRLPTWAEADQSTYASLAWMAMDCSCGFYVSGSSDTPRQSLTVQFAAAVHQPLATQTDYALVAWHGDYSPEWDGRKRGAAAALFDADGNCVAQARSFWVSI